MLVGKRRISGEIQTGSSFLSQNDPRVHIGRADGAGYERIEVQWPGGQTEVFPGGTANQIVTLKQGTGTVAKAQSSSRSREKSMSLFPRQRNQTELVEKG
jgi:hypothetical protein